jgi:ANTAR domain
LKRRRAEQLFVMEIERAAGVVVALRQCTVAEALDELLDASNRHRVPPLAVARALVALAKGVRHKSDAATAAARYEWGYLIDAEVMTR